MVVLKLHRNSPVGNARIEWSEQISLGLNPSWNISWDTSANSIQWYLFYQTLVHIQGHMWPTRICRVFCTLVYCSYVKYVNGTKTNNPTSMSSSNNWLRYTENIKPSPILPERGWIVGGWWHKLIACGELKKMDDLLSQNDQKTRLHQHIVTKWYASVHYSLSHPPKKDPKQQVLCCSCFWGLTKSNVYTNIKCCRAHSVCIYEITHTDTHGGE